MTARRVTSALGAGAAAVALLIGAPAPQGASAVVVAGTSDGVSPSATAAATCAGGVLTLSVTGQGLPKDAVVVATVPEAGSAGDIVDPAGTTENDGSFTTSFVLETTGDGVHTLILTPAGGDPVRASFDAPATCPRVRVVPARVAHRDGSVDLTLDAYGFSGGEVADRVQFAVDGTITATEPENHFGHAHALVTLKAVPDCGTHPVTALEVPPPPVPVPVPAPAPVPIPVPVPVPVPLPAPTGPIVRFQADPAPPASTVPGAAAAAGVPPALQAASSFEVTCPTVTADPDTLAEGDLPQQVTLHGEGWDPGNPIALTLDGVAVPDVTTDRKGMFSVPATLATRPCGTVPVIAVQSPLPVLSFSALVLDANVPPKSPAQPSAATAISVTCTPPPVTPPPVTPPPVDPPPVDPPPVTPPPVTPPPVDPPPVTPPPVTPPPVTPPPVTRLHPTLVADRLVSSGSVATATGTGFAPSRPVTLSWLLPDGTEAPGGSVVVAAADGRFTTPCLVLPHARLGPRTLRATQTTATGALVATTDVLIVTGPMEPGRDRLLGRR